MAYTCPFCQHEGPPVVSKKLSQSGLIVFIVLLFVCLPLCWLPFVLDTFKEDERKCASCGSKLG